MTKKIKIVLAISLSFMLVFSCVGYAAISSGMTINGTAEITPPNILFISDVSGGNYIDPNTLAYTGTVVSSNITLRENAQGEYSATYTVTLFNNTTESYYYVAKVHGTYTAPDGTVISYSNPNIELIEDIEFAEEIKPGEIKTFTVSAQFADDATDRTDKTLFSIIEYQFQTTKPEDKDEAAVAGVLEKFPEILNNSTTYNQLISAMKDNVSIGNRLSSSYIGNVVNANDKDTEAINSLFGESMKLNIDGEDKPVTVMIKRENIDGNRNTGESPGLFGGNEMTLYITADPLNVSGASVPVYAVVYTKNQNSNVWYQLGTVFKGTATVVNYRGGNGTGSFNTDTWKNTDGKAIENLV